MDQLARSCDLVPLRRRLADWQPGGLIDVHELRHPIPGQHPADRRAGKAQVIRDPVRTPPAGEPQRHDPPLRLPREPVRRGLRPEAAVRQRQPGPIPVDPPFRRRGRALEPFRCPPQRPAPIHDEDSKTTTPFRRQRRVSVRHEDLRGQDASVVTHILPGGLRLPHPFTTSRGSTTRTRSYGGSVVRMAPQITHDHATRNRSSSRISKPRRSPHRGHRGPASGSMRMEAVSRRKEGGGQVAWQRDTPGTRV